MMEHPEYRDESRVIHMSDRVDDEFAYDAQKGVRRIVGEPRPRHFEANGKARPFLRLQVGLDVSELFAEELPASACGEFPKR